MSIRDSLKHATGLLAGSDTFWRLLGRPLATLGVHLNHQRLNALTARRPSLPNQELQKLLDSLTVRRGPFAGLRFPEATNWGGALIPTLLGTYESELHDALEVLCKQDFKTIINVGCSEGYYAVGFAMRVPSANVWAFDTRADAQKVCRSMARLNQVETRVKTAGLCDRSTLKALGEMGPGLVICDIEGAEKELFDGDVAHALATYHVLIEQHDFVDLYTSISIKEAFGATHTCETIPSISADDKARRTLLPELATVDLNVRRQLLAERRHSIEWAHFSPRPRTE